MINELRKKYSKYGKILTELEINYKFSIEEPQAVFVFNAYGVQYKQTTEIRNVYYKSWSMQTGGTSYYIGEEEVDYWELHEGGRMDIKRNIIPYSYPIDVEISVKYDN